MPVTLGLKVSYIVGVYGTFNTDRLHHAIEVGNVSHRAGGEHKYHAIKQQNNTIIQHNHKLSSAWVLWR